MKIDYVFEFSDSTQLAYQVDIERPQITDEWADENAEEWTRLEHCQCANCPLAKSEKYCPAALDIQRLVADFKSQPAFQKVDVKVTTPERNYSKHAGLEEGLRSLMGLVLATSKCPILSELKPMAQHHMPFASSDEFILRNVSIYLIQQHFEMRSGREPDWAMKGLVDRNKRLQLVNQALWQRIHTVCEGDSNLKALLSFFSMASSVSFSLESQMQKLKTVLDGDNN
ncbi:DUF6901 family protein [Alkalimarinus coralli]|uniref:DUF6901 family protein n=1 Tax=Alkalimarinus coralli TaxID=2935863 RepID=UPI00202B63BA|nr:hypothetical protein [Alkalimarinus coralli]